MAQPLPCRRTGGPVGNVTLLLSCDEVDGAVEMLQGRVRIVAKAARSVTVGFLVRDGLRQAT